MIPRMIDFDAQHPKYQVRERDAWVALLIAHTHKIDAEAAGEVWTCTCRCCAYAWERSKK